VRRLRDQDHFCIQYEGWLVIYRVTVLDHLLILDNQLITNRHKMCKSLTIRQTQGCLINFTRVVRSITGTRGDRDKRESNS